ncbi:DUF1737 domain-containing protein [Hwanghaeella sp.]|uniref:DUF1737 domain-containing protein n=1 Tax=Hwanghaeella sp. TaxID=2605943 RepID=UPI003CCC2EE2
MTEQTERNSRPYYHVEVGEHQYDLMEKVNEKLQEGWELQGGVTMVSVPGETYGELDYYFAQAVVLNR